MQSISPTMCLKGRTVIDDYVFRFSLFDLIVTMEVILFNDSSPQATHGGARS